MLLLKDKLSAPKLAFQACGHRYISKVSNVFINCFEDLFSSHSLENTHKPGRNTYACIYSGRPENKSASNSSPIPIKRTIPHSPGGVYSNAWFMPWGMGWGCNELKTCAQGILCVENGGVKSDWEQESVVLQGSDRVVDIYDVIW